MKTNNILKVISLTMLGFGNIFGSWYFGEGSAVVPLDRRRENFIQRIVGEVTGGVTVRMLELTLTRAGRLVALDGALNSPNSLGSVYEGGTRSGEIRAIAREALENAFLDNSLDGILNGFGSGINGMIADDGPVSTQEENYIGLTLPVGELTIAMQLTVPEGQEDPQDLDDQRYERSDNISATDYVVPEDSSVAADDDYGSSLFDSSFFDGVESLPDDDAIVQANRNTVAGAMWSIALNILNNIP